MEIRIAEKMKELRRQRQNTQEELADFLGVKVQAVSKWERAEGMPDITFLPKIAGFYSISVDALLGVDEAAKEARFEAVMKEYRSIMFKKIEDDGTALVSPDTLKEGIAFIRNAIAELPDRWELVHRLACDLWVSSKSNKDKENELLNEAARLCQRILNCCKDDKLRREARCTYCRILSDMGNKQLAREMAEALPGVYETSDSLLADILEGEELEEHLCSAINRLAVKLSILSNRFVDNGFDKTKIKGRNYDKIRLLKVMSEIYE